MIESYDADIVLELELEEVELSCVREPESSSNSTSLSGLLGPASASSVRVLPVSVSYSAPRY